MKFSKGHIPWNKGTKWTERTNMGFQKGHSSYHTEESKRKIGEAHKGVKRMDLSQKMKGKIPSNIKLFIEMGKKTRIQKGQTEEKSLSWKGNVVGYVALHTWVKNRLGSPNKCENCGFESINNRKIHWANKSREYKRDVEDWLRLCVPCHSAYDNGKITLKMV